MTRDSATLSSPEAVAFTHDLRQLGVDGFANYLVETHDGHARSLPLRVFMYNDELEFADMFSRIAPQLAEEYFEIAKQGFVKAVDLFIERCRPIPETTGSAFEWLSQTLKLDPLSPDRVDAWHKLLAS